MCGDLGSIAAVPKGREPKTHIKPFQTSSPSSTLFSFVLHHQSVMETRELLSIPCFQYEEKPFACTNSLILTVHISGHQPPVPTTAYDACPITIEPSRPGTWLLRRRRRPPGAPSPPDPSEFEELVFHVAASLHLFAVAQDQITAQLPGFLAGVVAEDRRWGLSLLKVVADVVERVPITQNCKAC